MRVLLSTTAGSGHFGPLVPFGRVCAAAGHEVRVAAPASFAAEVSRAGFVHEPFADVPPDVMGEVFARLPHLSHEEANAVVIGDVFGRLDARAALPGLTALLERWRPDVVVRDPVEFASLAGAVRHGVPHLQVALGLGGALGDLVAPILRAPLAELARLVALPDDALHSRATGAPTLSTVPASLDGPPPSAGPPAWRFHVPPPAHDATLPPPWGDPTCPLVYVSFGSVAGALPPFAPLYRRVLDLLAGEPVRVLLTTGEGFDPDALGAPPANTRVERWWPQADVMGSAAAVVGHGGFGTTMLALAAGLPQVVIPLFALDQFVNAERVAAVGAGRQLAADDVAQLPGALRAVLADRAFRQAAQRVADEMAALPDVAHAVAVIEARAR